MKTPLLLLLVGQIARAAAPAEIELLRQFPSIILAGVGGSRPDADGFIGAKAFAFCGLLLDDDPLRAAARRLLEVALEQRDPSTGVFLENGGLDSSYNAASLLFGQVILLRFHHAELAAALPPAMKWQRTRILATGEVSVEGISRTGVGKETYLGQVKNVNTHEVALALAFWGATQGDATALAEAGRVFTFARESRRTPAGPKP